MATFDKNISWGDLILSINDTFIKLARALVLSSQLK